jgi:hypothetical protein
METNPDVGIVDKKETVELLDHSGSNLSRAGALSSIFEKMEQGVPVEEAVKVAEPKAKTTEEPKQEPPQETAEQKAARENAEKEASEKQRQEEEARRKAELETAAKEVPEAELQVLQSDKPKTAKRIQALLQKIEATNAEVTKTKAEAKEKADKLAELEQKLSQVKTVDPTTDEAIKKQLEELNMFRRQYELDKDPEVKAKFDDRIASSEKPIADILTRHGAEGLAKIIQEEGGWLKFAQSSRPIQLKDGPKPAAEVADLVLQNLPLADRQMIQSISMDQISTKRERDRFFEEERKKASEYFKKREEESQQLTKKQQAEFEAAAKSIQDWKKEMTTKTEWLKEKEIPSSATPEQKAAIEDDNKHTKQINQMLERALGAKDIPTMLEVVKDSVSFHQERRLHAQTQAKLELANKEIIRLKNEADNFKKASRSVPSRPGSLLASSGDKQEPKKPASIEEAFAEIEQQKLQEIDA